MGAQQKTQRVLGDGSLGEARRTAARGAEPMAANPEPESPSACERLMEEVCERGNLRQALKRVKANKGAPGVDGMTVQALPAYLREHWPSIRDTLLNSTYKPQPVRRVEIPKPDGGGVRKLGILLRLIDSSSRRSCRCCKGSGTRRSRMPVTASARDARHIRQWSARKATFRRDIAGL